jgi:SanA protein
MVAHWWVEYANADRVYDHVADIPARPVGLLLGTSKWVANGRINLYFRNRIDAAVALYEAGKIQHIIASGDNHRRGYNEPMDMLETLLARGIPREAITLDYAGFRTLDSVVRANAVFSQTQFTIISQDFHNRRALFISQFYQLDAIAFNAQDVTHSVHLKTQLREYLARVKAVLDLYVLATQPRFFGDKVDIEVRPVAEEGPAEPSP